MNSKLKPFMQPAFLVCVIVLAVACASKKVVIEYTGAILKKDPIELRKSFDLMDETALSPYKVVDKRKVENKEILESLGTEDYIQWELEDTEAGKYSPIRYCSLFITYYGKPDRVPHVPEECYIGSGNQQKESESISLAISNDVGGEDSSDGNSDAFDKKIKVKRLVFEPSSSDIGRSSSKFSRLYFFRVNGGYANDRMGVREIMGRNLFGKYSFFSKVEWQFFGKGYGTMTHPKEEEIVKASKKMLSVVLPVLENEHWPDWNELKGDSKESSDE